MTAVHLVASFFEVLLAQPFPPFVFLTASFFLPFLLIFVFLLLIVVSFFFFLLPSFPFPFSFLLHISVTRIFFSLAALSNMTAVHPVASFFYHLLIFSVLFFFPQSILVFVHSQEQKVVLQLLSLLLSLLILQTFSPHLISFFHLIHQSFLDSFVQLLLSYIQNLQILPQL